MIMKRYIVSVACVIAALVSCQKNETPVEVLNENQPIRLTLTASIGGDDTKVSYVEEDNVLKTEWELYDKVSVIALDISGNVLTNDIFTATSAGKVVEFDGEYSNNIDAKSIYVFYPALTEGEGTAESPWQVPADNAMRQTGSLYNVKVGACYLSFESSYQLQREVNDCSHLEQYAAMSGKADLTEMQEGEMKVILEHRSYVVKVQFTLPKEGLTVRYLKMDVKSEDGNNDVRTGGSGWTTINEAGSFPGGWDTGYKLFFGEELENYTGNGLLVEGTGLTAYIVSYAGQSWDDVAQETTWYHLTAGDYFSITVDALDAEESYECVLDKMTVTKDLSFENGKMYRMSATLVKKENL